MAATALILLLLSCMAMVFAAAVLFLVLRNKKKTVGGGDGGGGGGGGASGSDGPAPEFKSSTYTPGKELLSRSVSAVSGLTKNGGQSLYAGDTHHRDIVLPPNAPPVARGIRQNNRVYSRADAKKMILASLEDTWPVIKKYFGVEDWQKSRFHALLIGSATKESTVRVDIETPVQMVQKFSWATESAHAYGPFQTAVTAFKGCSKYRSCDEESDIPELKWYDLNGNNFYDPMISNFMGIRKMCHFALQAVKKYKASTKDAMTILRWALMGHNTGHANGPYASDQTFADYADMIGKMGEWYFKNDHLLDDAFTWTGNQSGHPTSYGAQAKGSSWRQNFQWIWTK